MRGEQEPVDRTGSRRTARREPIPLDPEANGNRPLALASMIRACSQLPVAISGGFSPADDAFAGSGDRDIVIVGRSVADSATSSDMAHRLSSIVSKINR